MEKLKALVADSTAPLRQFIRYSIEDYYGNIDVEAASNGKNIKSRIESTHFDLIIYDRGMPLLSGDELLKWLRSHTALKNIPVIIMSTDSHEESLRKIIELGATSFVVKPFKADAIIDKVSEIFGKADKTQHEKRKHMRWKAEGELHMKFGEHQSKGTLIDISRGGVLGRFEATPPYPQIMDSVLIKVKLKDGKNLNAREGNIVRIDAVDTVSGVTYIIFAVHFKTELSADMEKKNIQLIMKNV